MGCLPKLLAALLALPLLLGVVVLSLYALPRLGALPEGEALERVQASPHYHNGSFFNVAEPCGLPIPPGELLWAQGSRKAFARILWEAMVGSGTPGERPETPLPVVETDLAALPRERDCVVWFGHSSYLLQLAGKRILVDPVFGTASPLPGINRAFPGTESYYSSARLPEVDVLLITHDHYDHLDAATVQALRGRVGQVICPLGVGAHLRYWGYEPACICELDWGEAAELPGLRVNAHTAYHYSGRNVNTRRRVLWASYVLEGNGRKVFVGGDSGYATHFADMGQQYGQLDYAIMENGQYSPHWHQNHMLPHELPHALRDLRACRVLTVHHSKYKLSPHPWAEPLENALKLRESGFAVDIPRIGEPVYLDEPVKADSPRWWRAGE